jgi:hypothetical protein
MANDPAVVPDDKREHVPLTPKGLRELIAHVLYRHPDVTKTRNAGSVMINQFNLDVVDSRGDTWHVIVLRDVREAGEPQ